MTFFFFLSHLKLFKTYFGKEEEEEEDMCFPFPPFNTNNIVDMPS
jgi:hypothetical protein